MICARNHTVTIPLLQKENATREPVAHVVCGGGYSWLKWVKWWKSVEDIEQDVSSICFKTIPIGQGRGSFLRGNYFSSFFFPSTLGSAGPQSICMWPRKKASLGGEMAIGGQGRWTPGPLTASLEVWKVEKGWLMFMEAVAIKTSCSSTLLPISSILIPTFEGRLKWYQFSKHPICFWKECYQHLKEQHQLRDQYIVLKMCYLGQTWVLVQGLTPSWMVFSCQVSFISYRKSRTTVLLYFHHPSSFDCEMPSAAAIHWLVCGVDGEGGSTVAFSTTECLQLLDVHRINWDSSWSEGMHRLSATCSRARTKHDFYLMPRLTDYSLTKWRQN